ncbi:MAG: 6-phosphogluconolactonase [Desulfobacca sp.]|uniref:6-phosphogluconolactonase n=1 Tax=Desulfobacca sp. TaxID=2067990 RepID=UPI00404AE3AF
MHLQVQPDPVSAAQAAASIIAVQADQAVAQRGRFLLALSGGRSPWEMMRYLAALPLPWSQVQIFQVDERQAPVGHADRNLTHLSRHLVAPGALPAQNLHPLPVELPDLAEGARQYAHTLRLWAGDPPVLDLIHLGLGSDGHTASLIPGDPVLQVQTQDVAATGPYQGYRRLTLTFPMINRARSLLWLVTGADKAQILARLLAGDASLPASRIRRDEALILADAAAAGRQLA